MGRGRLLLGGAAIVAVGAIVTAVVATRGDDAAARDVIVTAEVGRQTLQDKVTLTGQLTRNEQRKVTAAVSGRVGAVVVKDGATVKPGDAVMQIDGRMAIAVPGDQSFYRGLDVGDRGADVRQLNQVLVDAGFLAGPVSDAYTERTRSALAAWQAAHDYPAATTAKSQTLTMTLGAGSGYKASAKATSSVVLTGTAPTGGGTTRPAVFRRAPVPSVKLTGSQSVEAGASATLTLELSEPASVDVQISLNVSGDATAWQDYVPVDPVVLLPAGQTTATLTLQTLPHTSITHDKRVIVSVTGTGGGSYGVSPIATAVVTVLGQTGDAAKPTITISTPSARVTKGQAIPVTLTMSQASSDKVVVKLATAGTAVAGQDFVLPATDVAVPAGQTSVSLQIATVVDKVVKGDVSLVVSLASSDAYVVGAAGSITTTIESTNVPELSVEASASSIGAGGTVTFTITADQPVAKDTAVSFQLGGTAQAGQDYQAIPTTVVLAPGETSAEVAIRAIRKDVVFKPGDMITGTWPARVGQVLVKADQALTPGTPMLSLTDAGFIVKLSASASDRTKLKVGQKVSAKLAGGTKTVPGRISKLDDTVTIDAKTGAQTYGGEVDVDDLGAADGATVTIDVVLDERQNALVVPIAAVKQDGTGKDVVRVIDLADGSRTREVAVGTGITQGAYIEVVSGLDGGEVIIVETKQTTAKPKPVTAGSSTAGGTRSGTSSGASSGASAPTTTAAR